MTPVSTRVPPTAAAPTEEAGPAETQIPTPVEAAVYDEVVDSAVAPRKEEEGGEGADRPARLPGGVWRVRAHAPGGVNDFFSRPGGAASGTDPKMPSVAADVVGKRTAVEPSALVGKKHFQKNAVRQGRSLGVELEVEVLGTGSEWQADATRRAGYEEGAANEADALFDEATAARPTKRSRR